MEKELINWLYSLKEDEIWVAEKIKEISNNNNHITIKSLNKYISNDNNSNNSNFSKIINKFSEIYTYISENQINLSYNSEEIIYKINDSIFDKSTTTFNKIFLICLEIMKNNKKLLLKKNNNNDDEDKNGIVSGGDSGGSLFLNKIWRNHSIKNEILYHCKLFKNHRFPVTFDSISKLNQYQFKDYLNYVQLRFKSNYKEKKDDFINFDNLEFILSPNVRILQIDGYFNDFIKPSSIPSTVKTLIFDDLDFIESSGIFKELNKITVTTNSNKAYYTNIPNGVESITHYQASNLTYEFIPPPPLPTTQLSRESLIIPNSIKSIKIQNDKFPIAKRYLNSKCVLKSLINSILNCSMIETFSFNFTINHYDLNFNKKKSNIILLPNSLTDLELIDLSLILGNNKSIKKGILPSQLKRLNLGGYYGVIEKDVLPSTLKSLILPNKYIKTIKEGCLPESLEYLSFKGSDCILENKDDESSSSSLISKVNNYFNPKLPVLIQGSIPIGLKTLKLSEYQNYLDILVKGTLTEQHQSLTKLSINPLYIYYDYNETESRINNWKIKKFIPSSLKNISSLLDFGSTPIKLINQLPITKIKIYSTTYNPESIPPSVTNIVFLKDQEDRLIKSFSSSENSIKSIRLLSKISICNLPLSLETLYCSNVTALRVLSQQIPPTYSNNNLINLKNLIIFVCHYMEVNLDNYPNLELLIIIGNINVTIKNYHDNSNLKKIIISNSNIKFLIDNPKLQSIIQVENINTIKHIKPFFFKNYNK